MKHDAIKVMIAEDQDIVRQGLKLIIDSEADIDVVATAEEGNALLLKLKQQPCDVVITDIQMPVMNGIVLTKKISEQYPTIKVLVLTTFINDDYVLKALQNGASGYLLKDASPSEIAMAIRTVHAGKTLLNQSAAHLVVHEITKVKTRQINPKVERLTDREIEILMHIGLGQNNKEIAKDLFLTEGTIKNNITRMLSKLELRDRTQLAIFAIQNDIIH